MIEIKSDKIITPDGVKNGYLYIDKRSIAGVYTEKQPANGV